jgi:hypothetical protein
VRADRDLPERDLRVRERGRVDPERDARRERLLSVNDRSAKVRREVDRWAKDRAASERRRRRLPDPALRENERTVRRPRCRSD